MADNVQPDAGEQREASSSGLFISTDPLQDEAGYRLAADDGDADATDSDNGDNGDDDDYDTDNGDSDGGDSDDGGPLVVEIGPGARASDGKDSDGTDENDPDYSDN